MENENRITRSRSKLIQPQAVIDEKKNVRVLIEKLNKVNIEDNDVNGNIHNSFITKNVPKFEKNSKNIIGREKEIENITSFIINHITTFTNANIYISGSPGTGKTLVVSEILNDTIKKKFSSKSFIINCMDFDNPTSVFRELLVKLTGKKVTNTMKAASEIEEYLKMRNRDKKPLILVLDEVDQLLSRNKKILYRILSWIEITESLLLIIGIANSLDLTERELPDLLLQSYRPYHINFPSYTEQQISSILMSQISVDLLPAELLALKYCSKKVAAQSGDARAALDLYKRAVELCELEKLESLRSESLERSHITIDPTGPSTPIKRVLSTPQLLAKKMSFRINPSSPSVKHVNRAINEVERGCDPFRNIIDKDSGKSTLPLHQKLVLCAGLILFRQQLKKPRRLGELFEKYVEICKSQDLEPIDMSNFFDISQHLVSRGLVTIQPHKESRQRIFTMNLDQVGIERALDDQGLLSTIMSRFMSN